MDNIGDVRLVDAHAERIGCGHDGTAVTDERLLIFTTLIGIQPCMIARGGKACLLQQSADLLDRLARGAIDDAALIPAFSKQLQKHSAFILRAQYLEAEIGPVKAGHDCFRLVQLQDTDNIGAHRRGGRCSKGRDCRAMRKPLQKFHDF